MPTASGGAQDPRDTEYGGNARGAIQRIVNGKRIGIAGPDAYAAGTGGSAIGGDGTDSAGASKALTVGEQARILRMRGMRPTIADATVTDAEKADKAIDPDNEVWAEVDDQRNRLDRQTSRYWRE